MITLFRWILLKQKQIKCRLAFWNLADSIVSELVKEAGSSSKNGGDKNSESM